MYVFIWANIFLTKREIIVNAQTAKNLNTKMNNEKHTE